MDWMRYRKIYFLLSFLVIGVGIISLSKWRLRLGLDFTGGTIAEYKFTKEINTDEVEKGIKEKGLNLSSIEKIDEKYLIRLAPIEGKDKETLEKSLQDALGDGSFEELRFETVGPSIGPELIKKTIYAIIIAASSIMIWVAYQFKSLKYGVSAILAMFHDSLVVFGLFSILGHFFGAEIDFLFVTALLTILSFSVHDTIVVYDRIRELQKKLGGDFYSLVNNALTETMVRSLNNSFTIIFMLLALILLGGTTIRWFAVALFVGTISGTYSSPFVAVPLLLAWDSVMTKIKPLKLVRKK